MSPTPGCGPGSAESPRLCTMSPPYSDPSLPHESLTACHFYLFIITYIYVYPYMQEQDFFFFLGWIFKNKIDMIYIYQCIMVFMIWVLKWHFILSLYESQQHPAHFKNKRNRTRWCFEWVQKSNYLIHQKKIQLFT